MTYTIQQISLSKEYGLPVDRLELAAKTLQKFAKTQILSKSKTPSAVVPSSGGSSAIRTNTQTDHLNSFGASQFEKALPQTESAFTKPASPGMNESQVDKLVEQNLSLDYTRDRHNEALEVCLGKENYKLLTDHLEKLNNGSSNTDSIHGQCLEVGAGTGRTTGGLAQSFKHVNFIASDLFPQGETQEEARKHTEKFLNDYYRNDPEERQRCMDLARERGGYSISGRNLEALPICSV